MAGPVAAGAADRPAGHRPRGQARPHGGCRPGGGRRRCRGRRGGQARCAGRGLSLRARRLAAAAHRRGHPHAGSRCRYAAARHGPRRRGRTGRRGAPGFPPGSRLHHRPDPIHHGRVQTRQGAHLDVQALLLNAFQQLVALQAQLLGQLVHAHRQRQLLPDATPVPRAGLIPVRCMDVRYGSIRFDDDGSIRGGWRGAGPGPARA